MEIKIKNLQKKYNDNAVIAIDDLLFEENKAHGIIGDNGAGKTTLLKIIAQLDDDYTGDIYYNGNEVDQDIIKSMTYITQVPYMLNMSVYKNIAYPLKIRKIDNKIIDNKVNEYLDLLKITHLKEKNAHQTSSGEKMRIALARALIIEPKVLFLDEPTTHLDRKTIEILKEVILKIKGNTTIFIISHDLKFVEALSDNVYYIGDRKLELRCSNV